MSNDLLIINNKHRFFIIAQHYYFHVKLCIHFSSQENFGHAILMTEPYRVTIWCNNLEHFITFYGDSGA